MTCRWLTFFSVLPAMVETVRSRGGWAKAAVNLFAGIHDDREADLVRGRKGRNRTGGVNMMVRIAPNVAMGGNEESL